MSECSELKIGRLITQYEVGSLSEKDRQHFEDHLLTCDFCFREITEMMTFSDSVVQHRAEISQQLRVKGISYQTDKQNLLRRRRQREELSWQDRVLGFLQEILRPKVYIPALVTVTALVAIFILPHAFQQPDSPYVQFLSFNKAPYRIVRAATETQAQQAFLRGMEAYQKDDFKGAVEDLKQAVRLNPEEGSWWMYLGVSYYLNRQAGAAIEALVKADSLTTNTLKNRSRWYLAQSYLLSGDRHYAAQLLAGLVKAQKEYAAEADALLKQLNSTAEDKSEH